MTGASPDLTLLVPVFNEGPAVDRFADAARAWAEQHPQPYNRKEYLGLYADTHGTTLEPYNKHIQELARHGLEQIGLFRLGREPRRWAAPLDIADHQRKLDHDRQVDRFGLECQSGPACRSDR